MPRTERYPHFTKLRKPQKCARCKGIIESGMIARYHNEFTGKRSYSHNDHSICDKLFEKNRKKCHKTTENCEIDLSIRCNDCKYYYP